MFARHATFRPSDSPSDPKQDHNAIEQRPNTMAKTESSGTFRWLGAISSSLSSRKNSSKKLRDGSKSPVSSCDSYDFTHQHNEHLVVSTDSSAASSRTASTASTNSNRSSEEALPVHETHRYQTLNLRRLLQDVTGRDDGAKWTSDYQVNRHFTRMGWRIVPIQPDGNCLFRAISDQLYNSEDFHRDIRKRVVDYIKREEAQFRPFLGDRGRTADETLKIYCARMSRDGEWGGNPELYAVAAMFNVRIVLHQGPARRLCIEPAISTPEKRPKKPILSPHRTLNLLFKDDHYSSVVTSDEPLKQQQEPLSGAQPEPEDECAAPEQEQPSTLLDLAVRSQMTPIWIETIHIPDCEVIRLKSVIFQHKRLSSTTSISSEITPASPTADELILLSNEPIVTYPRRASFRRGQLIKSMFD